MTRRRRLTIASMTLGIIVIFSAIFASNFARQGFITANYLNFGNFFASEDQLDQEGPSQESLLAESAILNEEIRPLVNTTISELSPNTGPVGTVVTIVGTGLSLGGNTINFAGTKNIIKGLAANGSHLSFTLPATPCEPETVCAQIVLTPGVYSLSVTNAQGQTSNNLNFTITED